METLKTIFAVIGIIAVGLIVFAFVRMTIALWRHNPYDFYNNH